MEFFVMISHVPEYFLLVLLILILYVVQCLHYAGATLNRPVLSETDFMFDNIYGANIQASTGHKVS